MIKVSLHDVLHTVKRAAEQPSEPSTHMDDVVDVESLRVILLKAEDADQVLPIWIGPFEAESLAMHLKQLEVKRPMTYDLTKTLLALGQVSVERAVIGRLHETTYYSHLIVKTGSSTAEVDCRPSDAVNLALRIGAPIYVVKAVMEQSGVATDEMKPPDNPAYQWQSALTPDAPAATHSPAAAPAPTQ